MRKLLIPLLLLFTLPCFGAIWTTPTAIPVYSNGTLIGSASSIVFSNAGRVTISGGRAVVDVGSAAEATVTNAVSSINAQGTNVGTAATALWFTNTSTARFNARGLGDGAYEISVTVLGQQPTNANLTLWSAIAPSAKADYSAVADFIGNLYNLIDFGSASFDGTVTAATVRVTSNYRSTDGTAGATATTGGATFKNGLYTGGTITGGGGLASNDIPVIAVNTVRGGDGYFTNSLYTPLLETDSLNIGSGAITNDLTVGGPFTNNGATYTPNITGSGNQIHVQADGKHVKTNVTATVDSQISSIHTQTNSLGNRTAALEANAASNLFGVTFTIATPAITVSNLFIAPGRTNVIECIGLTNIVLTNIAELSDGVNGKTRIAIRNTLAASVPIVWPAFGAQHGYFFHTNGYNDVLAATVAPPGTNTMVDFELDGTNVYPAITYWRH